MEPYVKYLALITGYQFLLILTGIASGLGLRHQPQTHDSPAGHPVPRSAGGAGQLKP